MRRLWVTALSVPLRTRGSVEGVLAYEDDEYVLVGLPDTVWFPTNGLAMLGDEALPGPNAWQCFLTMACMALALLVILGRKLRPVEVVR